MYMNIKFLYFNQRKVLTPHVQGKLWGYKYHFEFPQDLLLLDIRWLKICFKIYPKRFYGTPLLVVCTAGSVNTYYFLTDLKTESLLQAVQIFAIFSQLNFWFSVFVN